jgi:predicted ATPase
MEEPPSGTITFLFTDIEGSTRLWEQDRDKMRQALVAHDAVLRAAVASHGGFLFKHTGDGICAAFGWADPAISAAVDAQLGLEVPVRMGLATGHAEERDGDYFGPVLNRAARVMAAGHGGQILMTGSTAGVAERVDCVDLGLHRLRDLSATEHLFQVRAAGLRQNFPPLRTLDAMPGNLPVQTTSFIGREVEMNLITEVVRAHRLVTLTGVGGVGKTRLSLQAAAGLADEFPDGVWLVELAPVGDPAAVIDAVATTLAITAQPGLSLTETVVDALRHQRILIVLDNCEHVLEAAAAFVHAVLAGTSRAQVLATSREGLGLAGEHLWAVPSLGVDGHASEAVELFVERATAVNARFSLGDPDRADAASVICRRLDGIALAIELAAARMVSMSPQDVRDRLDDRFRLLAGRGRGLKRHQTLRQAVGWSYDLLDDLESFVLNRCAVFSGGFDLTAAVYVCEGRLDEYTMLDVLDSLVRKSLVDVEEVSGHARYGMLETIRQFAEERLVTGGILGEVRDTHARYFAERARAFCEMWDGPGFPVAVEWAYLELANLRAGFRWAADHDLVETATAIAAHTAPMTLPLSWFEPTGWAEEILAAATEADLPDLPRLCTAAGYCLFVGRPEPAVDYTRMAVTLQNDDRYLPFTRGWADLIEVVALLYSARIEEAVERNAAMIGQPGLEPVFTLCFWPWVLTAARRWEEARAVADQAIETAQAYGSPYWIGTAMMGGARAFIETQPEEALPRLRATRAYIHQFPRVPYLEAVAARDTALLEALHGSRESGLDLFEATIDLFHRESSPNNLAMTLASLGVFFDRIAQPDVAATLYGAATRSKGIVQVPGLQPAVEHLRATLGPADFDSRVLAGATMDIGRAVTYAREEIRLARLASRPT